jgi:hypothetical protein
MVYSARLTKPGLLVWLKTNYEGEKGCRLDKIQAENSAIFQKIVFIFSNKLVFA